MQDLIVAQLTCEYRVNPVGIDVAKPRLSWKLTSSSPTPRRGVKQTAYQIQVAASGDFSDSLIWDSGKVASDQSVLVSYEGPALEARTRYVYRVQVWNDQGKASGWSETAYWETGLLTTAEWKASWITTAQLRNPEVEEPADLFRKAFEINGQVTKATVYATALGLYELTLNGSRVGEDLFSPGWTSYTKRLQYQTYDVTTHLQNGGNALGMMVADGWYKGNMGWKDRRNLFGSERAALLQLHITFEDGSEQVVISDDSWTTSEGAIQLSEIYHGETYDARLEKQGWDTFSYSATATDWIAAAIYDHPKEQLIAQENEPARIVEQLKPIAIFQTPSGETVLDMGQNMVGWIRFSVTGEAGQTITLQHAEVLDKEGNFYIGNLRKAKQTNVYICKGEGEESYAPRFTFQGFRYVKVVGYPGDVLPEHFTGCVITTDLATTGQFECSNPLVNQLQRNIVWGQIGNFLDVPTDCPQRDERLGWTGDAQAFIRTSAFNRNVAPFFTKWVRDLKADQAPDGAVPFVIPDVLPDDLHSSSAWGDAAVICPWTIYLCYGDKRLLEEQYDSMKGWVEYQRNQGDNPYLWNTGFHFGDWLGLDAKEGSYKGSTPEDLIATAFYAYSSKLLAQAAEVLGKADDAASYRSLFTKVKEHFRNEFITPSGRLCASTQTGTVLALMFELVEGEQKARVIQTLVKLVEDQEYHLTTGFVGTPYLCHVLSENGHHDVALKLALQESFPSWLYPVTQGATTIWEHWDGVKADGSFWSDDMNSFNHYAYGAIGDWLYQVVAGIDTDHQEAGYKLIKLRPRIGEGFEYAKATLDSMYGEIYSGWELNDSHSGQWTANLSIPANTTAELFLPNAKLESLLEGGLPIFEAEGIYARKQTFNGVTLTLGSGSYQFTTSAAK
ncbi:family 78 glycoside hydrolase catalytic domain [Paenibacillus sp. S3N08]|uniref:alpha-L-rhamnosidase n=1 Tax=Paenibacillus agricola TaxID=2716264 RepID=A0ABX0JD06_9BACL|nr:family 78 glycoside hydrolase catalytic domain [Paenibacillus agricola]